VRTVRIGKNGGRIAVSVTVSPVRDAEGRVIGASAIDRDIGGQTALENALRISEERYRSLTLASAQIVWTKNAEGQVSEDWPMWRAFTGQRADELAGRGWANAVHPEDRERIFEVWANAAKTATVYETEYRVRRRDGEYRHMAVRGVPVLEPGGAVREWIGTCADITGRRRAEEEVRTIHAELEKRVQERTSQLEAANHELEAFSYSVSHDLRAPLRAIHGFSRILMEEYAPEFSGQVRHYLEVIHENALQMGELIDDLLIFSRLSRQPLQKQAIAPADLVAQALHDLNQETDPRIEVLVRALPPCEGDPALLKQVYVNLLSNSIKYTGRCAQARIEVGALPADGRAAVYYVRDNGVGFDMQYVHKLFGVFQRLHKASEYPGTGIGLAIVQRILQRHGGRIWAESELGRGATFYFTMEPEP
jgi:PAS domain S-box-containing protein